MPRPLKFLDPIFPAYTNNTIHISLHSSSLSLPLEFDYLSSNPRRISAPWVLFLDMSLRALDGIRVLDLSRVLAGPFCTMLLGDLGADVLKVERPGCGDMTRSWGPPFLTSSSSSSYSAESCYFLAVNRNKRSLAVDFKDPRGAQILRELAANADVVVENFVPGTMDAMGLGYDQIREINPKIVYASISGYGPQSKKPGFDVIAAAEGGLMSITGEQERPPVKVGVAITDICTGLVLQGAIASALFARERCPARNGQKIDTSLLEVQVAVLVNVASNFLNAGIIPSPLGTAHASIVPYQAFKTKDGYYVVGAGSDVQFQRLCKAIDRMELVQQDKFSTNAKRVENRAELIEVLDKIFLEKTNKAWSETFEKYDFPNGPVNDLQSVFENPHVKDREMVQTVYHEFLQKNIHMLGFPVKYSESPCKIFRAPPILGQHTDEVLSTLLKMDQTTLSNLKLDKVIYSPNFSDVKTEI